MDAEIKTKWIEALRSGKYKQARGKLRDADAYCCLGVLCRVARIPLGRDGESCGPKENGQHKGYYPIIDALGGGNYQPLVRLNDNGRTFAEIADYIEQNL